MQPTFTTLHLEASDDPIAHLVLNRPAKLNALSRTLLEEIVAACRWIDEQPQIKVVVVRGAGRAFCAGFDLSDFAGTDDVMATRYVADLGRRAADAVADLQALTIAAVHGHCIGGGVVLTTACDLRIAAQDTHFSIPEVDLGIPLAWGGIPRLVRELGPAVTKELVLTCRPFDAHEAKALRFVNTVVESDELLSSAVQLAEKVAAQPAFALRTTKQQVNAVSEEIAGTRRNAGDADALVTASFDPESRAAALRYLERRS